MSQSVYDMSGHEIGLFADIVGQISSEGTSPHLREMTAPSILDLLRADTFASYIWDDGRAAYVEPVAVNHDPDNVRRYIKGLHRKDPLTDKMRRLTGAQIVDDHFPMSRLSRTDFFRSFLRGDDMFYGINIFQPIGPKRTLDLRIWRSARREPFSNREKVLLAAVTERLGTSLATAGALPNRLLTKRERDVTELVARGCTDRDIARILGISFSTVRTHINRCFDKLGCANRAELVATLTARTV